MKKIKLTKAEQAIEDAIEEFIPVSNAEYEEIARALATRKKDAVLNLRINSADLKNIKRKAYRMGLKYQTFISEILHRIAQAS